MGNVLLTADSGSTKTTWVGQANGQEMFRHQTPGINPFMLDEAAIKDLLRNDATQTEKAPQVADIRFVGAGCRGAQCDVVRKALQKVFAEAQTIVVDSDWAGAAHALLPEGTGIACIMGPGSNGGLFLRGKMVHNVSPLGYVLGDEGSGAVLGKLFFNALYKGFLPIAVRECFEDEVKMTYPQVIQRVYREPMANRFLASVSPFIARHKAQWPELSQLVVDNFRAFFRRNISRYQFSELPVNTTGSVAFAYQNELSAAARAEGYVMGKIEKQPMPGLIAFHADC